MQCENCDYVHPIASSYIFNEFVSFFTGSGQTEPSLPVDEQARFDYILVKPISSKKLLKIMKTMGFASPMFTFAIANAGDLI